MTGPGHSYLMSGFITEDRKTWEVYGDPEKSICNGKSFRGTFVYGMIEQLVE